MSEAQQASPAISPERADAAHPLAQPPVAPLLDDGTLAADLDIAFSTHLTVVVPARIDFDAGTPPQHIHLVIPRARCRNSRPLMQALLDAAQSALGRCALAGTALRRPRALSARVAGQWHALWAWPSGITGPALRMS